METYVITIKPPLQIVDIGNRNVRPILPAFIFQLSQN